MSADDEEGIIGSRPRKPIEKQLEGLSLFDDPRVREEHKAPDRAGARVLPVRLPEPKRKAPQQLPLSERDRERLAAIERLKELVEPKLLALAAARKDRVESPGVTADDVHLLVMQFPQSALLGSEQRSLSWGGPWLVTLGAAGKLKPFKLGGIPVLRRSTRKEARRNRQQVWLHPDDHRVR